MGRVKKRNWRWTGENTELGPGHIVTQRIMYGRQSDKWYATRKTVLDWSWIFCNHQCIGDEFTDPGDSGMCTVLELQWAE